MYLYLNSSYGYNLIPPAEIKLSDMLADLHQVVGWLLLGIHLDVPLSDLQKIRHQFNENVDQCKTEMLITYSKLKEPSWVDIVDALRRSGERALAVRLARKHGNDCHLTCKHGNDCMSPDRLAVFGQFIY